MGWRVHIGVFRIVNMYMNCKEEQADLIITAEFMGRQRPEDSHRAAHCRKTDCNLIINESGHNTGFITVIIS